MSLHSDLVAFFIFIEFVVTMTLVTPTMPTRLLKQLLQSQFYRLFYDNPATFYCCIGVLHMCLYVSLIEIKKYSGEVVEDDSLASKILLENYLRTERNCYYTGFAIFCMFIIKRLSLMIIDQIEKMEEFEIIQKKANDTLKQAKEMVNLAIVQIATNSEMYEDTKSEMEFYKRITNRLNLRLEELAKEATEWKLKYEGVTNVVEGHGVN